MTETAFPFDAGAGAGVTEAQWRKMARLWHQTGVVPGEGSELEVTAGDGLSVLLADGIAWIRGHYYENDAELALPLQDADPTLDRIDRAVIRADFVANTIAATVLEGTPDAAPVPPALTQDESAWEIPLYQVAVAAAATELDPGDLTDERGLDAAPGSFAQANLGADVALGNAGFTEILAVTLPAGPWLVMAQVSVMNTSGTKSAPMLRITEDGTTVHTGTVLTVMDNGWAAATLVAIVDLAAEADIALEGMRDGAVVTTADAAIPHETPAPATRLLALRMAT